jgi:hypothetical protein
VRARRGRRRRVAGVELELEVLVDVAGVELELEVLVDVAGVELELEVELVRRPSLARRRRLHLSLG